MPLFPGVRTRELLIAALIAVIVTVTGGSLLIVRNRVRRNVARDLSADLARSLTSFQDMQRQRRDALIHENALLADLPSLKALMTTHDQRTIADGAIDLWRVSGSDLFALADSRGQVLTIYTQGDPPKTAIAHSLQQAMTRPQVQYLSTDDRLFDFAVRPLYFGDDIQGTLLGYVISGYRIDRNALTLITQVSGDEATFLSGTFIMASTLSQPRQQELMRKFQRRAFTSGHAPKELSLGGEQYLATVADLSGEANGELRLVVLKSFAQANRAIREINRLVLLLGVAALVLGSLLMVALSRVVTGPLETLAQGVRAFGVGDTSHGLPETGTREVRELSSAFARMRGEILETNRALLDAERLATIGSMASSVSHDLRHYLAAVYANAEFLSSSRLSQKERDEFLADIWIAVHGATELLESLLIFSRTGAAFHHERESLVGIVEKSISLLKPHPEAEGVSILLECDNPSSADAIVDAKQMQRAIFNLLLNGCQSARKNEGPREVKVSVATSDDRIVLSVTDSGPGVPPQIRNSLFEPFVSDGKQSGTGLGLTLANAIAKEHGGKVTLLSTRPGETIFQLVLIRNLNRFDTGARPKRLDASVPSAGGTLQ
jgi:signal transduction histidine kinase